MPHWPIASARITLLALLCLYVSVPLASVRAAESFADPAFRALWERTDGPVAANHLSRTFLWGPAPLSAGMTERYAQSPGGKRLVQYFVKSRMEITNPAADPSSPTVVTNGLLVIELMTGRVQTGNDPTQFEQRDPAAINAVGDGDDPNAPTYVTLARLRDLPARAVGAPITEMVDRSAAVSAGGPDGVAAAVLAPETRHTVASVFWVFMNSAGPVGDGAGGTTNGPLFANPFYATRFPVTEAYWTTVRVAGVPRQVLMQAFERRVLTYTPGNPSGFEVEAGNVGAHYYRWRYQALPTTSVDPAIPVGPIQAVNVLMGRYNLTPGDMPSGFQFQLDGEATNGLVSRNDADPNYGAYLKAWQRVTGYRRVFVRTEPGNQASAIQSLVSLFRTPDGAVAALNFNRDRLRNLPAVALTDGPFGANSYLVVDRSNENVTTASLVWADANVLASVDLSMPPRGAATAVDLPDLAGRLHHRLVIDSI
ncbi:MAG: hypothetical protein ACR2JW_04050 [Thermomicrobiales bacterium]